MARQPRRSRLKRDSCGYVMRTLFSGSAAIFAVIVASIIWIDGPVAEYFKPRFGSTIHVLAVQWTDWGRAEPYFMLSTGIGFGSWILMRFLRQYHSYLLTVRNWGVQALVIFLFCGTLVQVAKHIIGRKRPYAVMDLSPHEFHPLTGNYEFHSMPSGHSQVVFSAATLLTIIWPRLAIFWLGGAICIAASRVITLNHWVSDTFAGAFLGVAGTLLARLYLQRSRFKVS